MKRCAFMSVILLVLAPPSARATTYYVSQSGDDMNSCEAATDAEDQTRQKLTISSGLACLSGGGDTLYIHGGDPYTGPDNTISAVPSGTSWDSPVTVAGFPGETVIIQPPDESHAIELIGADMNMYQFIIFQDLITDGSYGSGLTTELNYLDGRGTDYIRFLRVEMKNAWKHGILIAGDHNEILSCKIHGNGRGPDDPVVVPGNSGYGIYAKTTYLLLSGSEIYDNHGYGMQLLASNNTVSKNSFHDNGAINNPECPPCQTTGTNYAFNIGDTQSGVTSSDNLVYDNLIYGNRGGILVYTNSANTGVYNNTIYNNGSHEDGNDYGGAIDVQYISGDVTIQNNILFANTENTITDRGDNAGAIIQDHNLDTDPMFTNADAADFSIPQTSAAFDAGVTIEAVPDDFGDTIRPQFAAYDIGAFEYAVAMCQ